MKNKLKILIPLVLILSLNLIGCGVNSEKNQRKMLRIVLKLKHMI